MQVYISIWTSESILWFAMSSWLSCGEASCCNTCGASRYKETVIIIAAAVTTVEASVGDL